MNARYIEKKLLYYHIFEFFEGIDSTLEDVLSLIYEDVTLKNPVDLVMDLFYNHFFYVYWDEDLGDTTYRIDLTVRNGEIWYEEHGWNQAYLLNECISDVVYDTEGDKLGDVIMQLLQSVVGVLCHYMFSGLIKEGLNSLVFTPIENQTHIVFTDIRRESHIN